MKELILEYLFDSPVRVRLLKLFVHNPEQAFDFSDVVRRIRSERRQTRRELNNLVQAGFIKQKKGKTMVYQTDPQFIFLTELKNLVTKSSPASKERMLLRLRRLGRIKLALLSGIFMNADNAKADMLIVGDGISETRMAQFSRDLEAEVGKELDYVVLSSEEFKYRYSMYDRFVRDLLERPHEKLVNRLGL